MDVIGSLLAKMHKKKTPEVFNSYSPGEKVGSLQSSVGSEFRTRYAYCFYGQVYYGMSVIKEFTAD